MTSASRPAGYGLTAQMGRKIREKYDLEDEAKIRAWIEHELGEVVFAGEGMDAFHAGLRDGKVLCKLANKLVTGSIRKINQADMTAFNSENIGFFLKFCTEYLDVESTALFQSSALIDKTDMNQVLVCLLNTKRKAEEKGLCRP